MIKSLDLQEDVDAAAALWQSLRAKLESDNPEIPTVQAAPVAAEAAPAPAAPAGTPDIFKSVTDL